MICIFASVQGQRPNIMCFWVLLRPGDLFICIFTFCNGNTPNLTYFTFCGVLQP